MASLGALLRAKAKAADYYGRVMPCSACNETCVDQGRACIMCSGIGRVLIS